MACMVVTLEVSKLSGWLNAIATCRVEKGGACDAGQGAGREAGGRGAAAAQAARTGKARLKAWGPRARRAERTWNMRFMFVTLEVSQLEMSALKFCKL